jgi:hypothetical protein
MLTSSRSQSRGPSRRPRAHYDRFVPPPPAPPWTVEETAPCFIGRDVNRQALAFVYCEDEPGRRTTGKLLTRDEARRIAANIAKLPQLLKQPPQ